MNSLNHSEFFFDLRRGGGGGIQYINLKLNIYSYMGLHVIFHGMIFSCDVHKKTEHNLKLLRVHTKRLKKGSTSSAAQLDRG